VSRISQLARAATQRAGSTLPGRRRAGEAPLNGSTLLAVLASAPVPIMVTDAVGELVYRNAATVAVAEAVALKHGDDLLAQLRRQLGVLVSTATGFPVFTKNRATLGERWAETEVTVVDVGGGYRVVAWRDVTQDLIAKALLDEVATELSDTSMALTQLSGELVSGAEGLAQAANAVASGAEQMSFSINEVSAEAGSVLTNSRTAVQYATLATGNINRLAESVDGIASVSQLIKAIADQTRMLALNAAIEAASAGVAGRGFAVVADEVKALAQRITTATREILDKIDATKLDSVGAVDSIEAIVGHMSDIERQQAVIAHAMEEQTATANEITVGISSVARAAQSTAQAGGQLRDSAGVVSAKAVALQASMSG
jgi:hypothetical protein